MTSYVWAQLPASAYDLPGPAVLTNPWVLEARMPRRRRIGFTHVTRPRRWRRLRTARGVIAEYADPADLMVVGADEPTDIDADGLRDLTPGARRAGGVHWTMGSPFPGPTATAFHDQVHRAGRLLLLTGDPSAYWAATDTGTLPAFDQLYPGGAWAASIPLLTHLYDTGVGTRPLPARG